MPAPDTLVPAEAEPEALAGVDPLALADSDAEAEGEALADADGAALEGAADDAAGVPAGAL